MEELLTPAEACAVLKLRNAVTLRRWVKAGRLTAVKLTGGTIRYRRADLEALTLASLETEAPAETVPEREPRSIREALALARHQRGDTVTVALAATGPVMMGEQEARRCVARIKAGLEDVRKAALDLEEREGYLALGYKSWRACVKAEFADSIATVYRQLRAAKIDREVSQVETTPVRLPTVQTEELARLPDPESRQTAYLAARAESGGHLTQAAVKRAVDRVGRSLTSGAVASDNQDPGDDAFGYSQVAPDYDDGQDSGTENESQERHPSNPGKVRCHQCGEYGPKGVECPCLSVPDPDAPTERPGDHPAASDTGSKCASVEDSVPPASSLDGQETEEADAGSEPAAGESDAEGTAPDASPPPPSATLHSSQMPDPPLEEDDEPSPRTGKKKGTVSASRVLPSDHQIDAGGVTRVLIDMPGWREEFIENLPADEKRALRDALGGTAQMAPTTPAGAPTIADVKASIDRMESGFGAVASHAVGKLDLAALKAHQTLVETKIAAIENPSALGLSRLVGAR